MQGYLLTLAYRGGSFCGWQVQPGKRSVQGVLQDACEKLFGIRPPVTGCSRTDSGVHARGFVSLVGGSFSIPCEALPRALNSLLPDDISVISAFPAEDGFHPRYDAKGKEYIYTIRNSEIRDPFTDDFCWLFPRPLDESKMREEAHSLEGKHDFRAFMAAGSKITDTVRTVDKIEVTREGESIYIRVSADGFLYNMVRIIVGTLVGESTGELKMPVSEILASGDRSNAGMTAPAKGLCLNRVFY